MAARRRGYILILTITVIAVLMIFAIAYVNFYRGEKILAQNAEKNLIAEAAADAGIQDALCRIKISSDWQAGFTNVALSHSGATYNMTFVKNNPQNKYYSTNNSAGPAAITTGWPGNRVVPAGAIHLVSVGTFRGDTRIEQALITLKPQGLFMGAASTQRTIEIQGNAGTDSYNSTNGAYGGTNIGTNGNIRTNIGDNGSIDLQGSVNIQGTATYTGNSNSEAITTQGAATYITPGIAASSPITFPPVDIPTDAVSININNGYTFTQSGNYVVDSIAMNGATIILANTSIKVNLYVRGDIRITGNPSINGYVYDKKTKTYTPSSAIPGNFIVYGSPNTRQVEIDLKGTPSLYWAVYAPEADVYLKGNVSLYGAIISNTLEIYGNAKIHYDEALQNLGNGSGQSEVVFTSRW